jgi:pyridoxal phosphate enzyme (YggS family)
MVIKSNIKDLLAELQGSKAKLIAVSKTQPIEKIKEAYDAGQRLFGENKAQEMLAKYQALPEDMEWHMIGHLQTNKVKYITSFVSLIHSVDSEKLLEEIDKQGKKAGRIIPCLLQVHIAMEETKFGFSAEEVSSLLGGPALPNLKNIEIRGLMGMATFTENKETVRGEFQSLKKLFDQLKERELASNAVMKELSMGMSSDYKIALQEGSTYVRIGTAIFGERNYLTN